MQHLPFFLRKAQITQEGSDYIYYIPDVMRAKNALGPVNFCDRLKAKGDEDEHDKPD
jgi:hypothetical protein